jgi:hypothetical protein
MRSGEKVAAFHVGAHKTGTSVFQQYLRQNPWLMRRKRILVVGRAELAGYVGWGEKLIADPRPLIDRVERLRRSPVASVLIGSCENLLGRPFPKGGDGSLYPAAPRNIEALARATKGVRGKAILAIRPQEEFLESYYLQTVHEGRHHTFDEWLARVDLDALSWRPVVDALHEAFGPADVEVVDFGLIAAGQDAFISHLLTRIDPRLDFRVSHDLVKNRSVSARGLEMALEVNPHLKTGAERRALRILLQTHFSNLDFPRPALLSDEQKHALRARYGPEYADLLRPAAMARAVG